MGTLSFGVVALLPVVRSRHPMVFRLRTTRVFILLIEQCGFVLVVASTLPPEETVDFRRTFRLEVRSTVLSQGHLSEGAKHHGVRKHI